METVAEKTIRGGPPGLALLIAGFVLGALLCCAAAFCPPYEGDAYEYGEVALRWVRHGAMTERHLRTFNIPGQPVTHPAAQRANYYTVLVAPFAAAFGPSMWTVFIPGLLGVLAIPLLTFFAGRDLFGRRIAWWAALLCLFNPRLIYHALRDPTPESLLAALCLASVWLFAKKKYPASGALLGIAFFVKQSAGAFLPAYFIFALLSRRDEFTRKNLYLGLLAFILLASPFLIRNQLIFHNPLYTEETAARQHFNPQTLRDGNLLRAIFERGDQAPGDHAADSKSSFLVKTLSLADMNLRDNILGTQNIDYFPGFLPLIYAACVPLFAAGLWFGRRSETVRLFAICIICYLAFHILIVVHFETRYIFPVLPFGLLIAAYGAFELGRAIPRFKPEAALIFALITGALTVLPIMAIQTTNREERTRALEYIAACRALEKTAPRDSVVAAWPPFSAAFYSDRQAIPLVYGDLYKQIRTLDKYGADYLLYNDLALAGELPLLDLLRPVAKGSFMSLYEIDASAPGFKNPAAQYSDIANFNPLEIVYKRTMDIPIRLDWPLETFLTKLLRGPVQAAAVFLAAFALFHFLAAKKSRAARAFAIIFIIVFCLGARIAYFFTLDMSKLPGKIPPRVYAPQVAANTNQKDSIRLIGDYRYESDKIIKRELEKYFKKVELALYLEELKNDESVKNVFYPVNERMRELTSAADVLSWKKTDGANAVAKTRKVEAEARAAGFNPIPVGGGVLLTRKQADAPR